MSEFAFVFSTTQFHSQNGRKHESRLCDLSICGGQPLAGPRGLVIRGWTWLQHSVNLVWFMSL